MRRALSKATLLLGISTHPESRQPYFTKFTGLIVRVLLGATIDRDGQAPNNPNCADAIGLQSRLNWALDRVPKLKNPAPNLQFFSRAGMRVLGNTREQATTTSPSWVTSPASPVTPRSVFSTDTATPPASRTLLRILTNAADGSNLWNRHGGATLPGIRPIPQTTSGYEAMTLHHLPLPLPIQGGNDRHE